MTDTNFKIVVLVKLAIDTRQTVSGTIMNEDGTMNRAALPSVFNPDDKKALEMALRIKHQNPTTTITVMTMGADIAASVLKEAIYIGADNAILLSDRKFAGADTLATSYVLAKALAKISPDLVLAGRQTIDGDTGQVGPQVAQWLGIPQVTYATEIDECNNDQITLWRTFENHKELLSCKLPALITTDGTANECRPMNAKRYMTYKHMEVEKWTSESLDGDESFYGLKGSPTQVSKVFEITAVEKESKRLGNSDEELQAFVQEIINNRLIG